jgi:hypothetical protein
MASNVLPFQATRIPPEAPTDGRKSKQSKTAGHIFLKKGASKFSFFVSCRQIISHCASTILFLTESHFHEELIPLTFQVRTFQLLI